MDQGPDPSAVKELKTYTTIKLVHVFVFCHLRPTTIKPNKLLAVGRHMLYM